MSLSKIPTERLREVITGIVTASAEKKRKFLETIELQAVLKNYDVNKDKRFAGSIKLPNIPRPNLSVCILGDAYHVEEAQKNDVPYMDVEALKALNKDKEKVKKLGELPRPAQWCQTNCVMFCLQQTSSMLSLPPRLS